jgi:hypothetical protein
MEAFPFTEAEWESVREAAGAIVNAALAEDPILRASQFAELRAVLAGLRDRYGDHPLLLETEADFTADAPDRVALYERASRTAAAGGLPTLTIRLSLARVLLEDLGRPDAARVELLACRGELATVGDESDREEWASLLAACDRRTPAAPDRPGG